MKPLLITSGDPAGIGPDICLDLMGLEWPLVVVGDKQLFLQRAKQLKREVTLVDYEPGVRPITAPNHLTLLSLPCPLTVTAGKPDPRYADYVLAMLTLAVARCLSGEFSALVTAPVHKGIINQAGYLFTGHTEFLASQCQANTVVMMLACSALKVALMTTHVPLREVPDAITFSLIVRVINQLDQALKRDYGLKSPRIAVAGLNPHAGESGFLGREELDIIEPALEHLRQRGIRLQGPLPADTVFTPKHLNACDVVVAMYHDQGLPVLKYAGFGQAVNVTLGLPIIRTSVDHGTAFDLAATGKAESTSLLEAVRHAAGIALRRKNFHNPIHEFKDDGN